MGLGYFCLIIAIAVLFLVFTIVKLKMHPVLSLFLAAVGTGLAFHYGIIGTMEKIASGLGNSFGGIALMIIFGAIIAMGITDSGAMKSMCNAFIRAFRGKFLDLVGSFCMFIMAIPVFADVGLVLLSPVLGVIAKRKKISMSTMVAYMTAGSYAAHSLIPPTPGILAVALLLGVDLGKGIFWGFIIGILATLLTYIFTRKWVAKEFIEPMPSYVIGIEPTESNDYHDILIKEDGLPGAWAGFAPIIIPVLLITLRSFFNAIVPDSAIAGIFNIIGYQDIALFIGVVIVIIAGFIYKDNVIKNNALNTGKEESNIIKIIFGNWVERALLVSLAPLLITAMGGAFSAVIKAYPGISTFGDVLANAHIPGIIVPFFITVVLQTAVGSTTTAQMTSAAIVLPMLPALGISPLAAMMIIGAGGMIISHLNDSGFWTLINLNNLSVKQGLKYSTIPSAVCGLFSFAVALLFIALGII